MPVTYLLAGAAMCCSAQHCSPDEASPNVQHNYFVFIGYRAERKLANVNSMIRLDETERHAGFLTRFLVSVCRVLQLIQALPNTSTAPHD